MGSLLECLSSSGSCVCGWTIVWMGGVLGVHVCVWVEHSYLSSFFFPSHAERRARLDSLTSPARGYTNIEHWEGINFLYNLVKLQKVYPLPCRTHMLVFVKSVHFVCRALFPQSLMYLGLLRHPRPLWPVGSGAHTLYDSKEPGRVRLMCVC